MSKPSNKGVVPLALRMRVRTLLDTENVTQSNLARFCHVTASTMSHWIRDTGVLSVQMVAETSGKFERLLDQVKPGTLSEIIDTALAKLPPTGKESRKSTSSSSGGTKPTKARKRGRPAEPRPTTPQQMAAAELAARIPYTFGVPQSALADAGYAIETDGSRGGRGGGGSSDDDDDDDDDDSVFDVPVGTVHPRFATVTPMGMAAAKAAAASARAAGGQRWSADGTQVAVPATAVPAASGGSTPAGSVAEPTESSASFEFAFILRDMRRPLSNRPVIASLPVSKNELAWTYDNTGCLQVPGHGIEDSDSDDVRERHEVVKRLARIKQQ